MNERLFNKNVRMLFAKLVGEEKVWNCSRYNNPTGIVWKSYGHQGYKAIWEKIIAEVGGEWELFEGASWRGDGSVYGMKKKK